MARVLIVEDEGMLLDMMCTYMRSAGHEVSGSKSYDEALDLQDELQSSYTHGAAPVYERAISSVEACKDLVRGVVNNYKLPYITITPAFSVCAKHGYISGEHEYCPKCDE